MIVANQRKTPPPDRARGTTKYNLWLQSRIRCITRKSLWGVVETMGKILVTGASGLLGQHLCRQLLARGYEVRGFIRPSSRTNELPDGVEKMRGDICDAARVHDAVSGCEGVIHSCCTHVTTCRAKMFAQSTSQAP
jgi:FlaA1/EpsC-like NDP-sugar epimerase